MAQRRMFSKKIIDTDLFIDMPPTARLLYYDLAMRADDDGFVSSPKRIQRMVCASDDDMRILISKQFLIPFESGVCVIKHWRIHNYIQTDRYNPTFYNLEKSMLDEENGTYELVDTKCIQDVSKTEPQVRLELGKSKDRIGKVNNISKDIYVKVIDQWNSIGVPQIKIIQGNREKLFKARIKEFGEDSILQAIENIKYSSFLKGQNKTSWVITFDWFIKPNNFVKVLEDNYNDNRSMNKPNTDNPFLEMLDKKNNNNNDDSVF